jgi:hypothetical protein
MDEGRGNSKSLRAGKAVVTIIVRLTVMIKEVIIGVLAVKRRTIAGQELLRGIIVIIRFVSVKALHLNLDDEMRVLLESIVTKGLQSHYSYLC